MDYFSLFYYFHFPTSLSKLRHYIDMTTWGKMEHKKVFVARSYTWARRVYFSFKYALPKKTSLIPFCCPFSRSLFLFLTWCNFIYVSHDDDVHSHGYKRAKEKVTLWLFTLSFPIFWHCIRLCTQHYVNMYYNTVLITASIFRGFTSKTVWYR